MMPSASEDVAEEPWLELFVPGRICIMGEHSDWAGGFRALDPNITEGYCLVSGTEQGLYARVRRCSSAVKMTSTTERGVTRTTKLGIGPAELLAAARAGGFFSYLAGVAYQLRVHNEVGGIEIENYRTTLPLGKGLSSSAALCVLVARAFNKCYDLKYSVRGEMELAFKGETTTPSKCGRMDQCCAFGQTPVVMEFDGDVLSCEPLALPPGASLHFVLVDLCASKDTTAILAALSAGYPTPLQPHDRPHDKPLDKPHDEPASEYKQAALADASRKNADSSSSSSSSTTTTSTLTSSSFSSSSSSSHGAAEASSSGAAGKPPLPHEGLPQSPYAVQLGVRQFLGPTNKALLTEAKAAFLAGDARRIGHAMREYQVAFDSALQPACPEQLTSPVLHKCLAHPSLQPLVFGGKGMGSQGDGTAQLLCTSAAAQAEVSRIVEEELGMVPFALTLSG